MHSNCILDSVANPLVRHMVFIGNVQKSPIASCLKGLDPSLDFCCQGPAYVGRKLPSSHENAQLIEPHHEKTCSSHMRKTKAQISLRIRAV